jgi:hypothetical protein
MAFQHHARKNAVENLSSITDSIGWGWARRFRGIKWRGLALLYQRKHIELHVRPPTPPELPYGDKSPACQRRIRLNESINFEAGNYHSEPSKGLPVRVDRRSVRKTYSMCLHRGQNLRAATSAWQMTIQLSGVNIAQSLHQRRDGVFLGFIA